MRNRKKTAVSLMIVGLCGCLNACNTTAVSNANSYFANVKSILKDMNAGQKVTKTVEAKEEIANRLEAPTEYVISKDGGFSFQGVENADYYVIYFCAIDAVDEDADFISSSEAIKDKGTPGETYTGSFEDIMQYAYGTYLTKVVAFPKLEDSEHSQSLAATGEYSVSGAIEEPVIDYFWNTFNGEMSVQLTNAANYEYQAWPDQIDITFANMEEASDTLTLSFTDISSDIGGISTTDLTPGETYRVTVETTTENPQVTNQIIDSVLAEELVVGENNLVTRDFVYSDGFIRDAFKFPRAIAGFNLAEGGSVGEAKGDFGYFTMEAVPVSASAGSLYTYDVSTVINVWNVVGTMELKADGTFAMKISGEGPVVNGYIRGTWHEDGEGTVALSYDGSSVVIGSDVDSIEL